MEIKVNFIYKGKIIQILGKSDEEMSNVLGRLVSKLNPEASINDYAYYFNEEEISHESTLAQNLKINDSSIKEVAISVKRKIKYCKCPECKCNDCIVNLSNYLCAFYGCKYHKDKAHEVVTVYDNYKAKQTINFSEIMCQAPGCEKNLENDEYDFYKCLDCSKREKISKYYCFKCKKKHKNSHTFIKYDEKHYYCDNHLQPYEKSCLTCEKDLCKICEMEHLDHKIVTHSEMTTDIESLKASLNKIKDHIETLDEVIDNIKYHLDGTKRIYERYYNISLDILKKYETFNQKLKNYRILRTIRNLNFSNKQIICDLEKIINNDNLQSKCSIIIDAYQKKEDFYKGVKSASIKDIEKESNDIWYEEILKNRKIKIKKSKDDKDFLKMKGIQFIPKKK